ncbi:MAG TPA: AMP-binding protein [Vineibacter sp.]|nr:AMP-binding protein [Vineibacter sp.]
MADLVTSDGVSLYRLFDFARARWPDRTALIDDAGQATFAELEVVAGRLLRRLIEIGARRGDRVALILPNGIPFIVVELAVLRGGMVKVPLNIRFHVNEVMYALNDCEPTVLICDEAYARAIAPRRADTPSLRSIIVVGADVEGTERYEDIVTDGAEGPPPVRYAAHDPAVIRYTGGTTGRPKGVVHTERSLLAIALDQLRELTLDHRDIALHLGHLSHGMNYAWPAYYAAGATQILRERFDPKAVLRDLQQHRVTCVYMVPTMIHRLLREDDGTADVSQLRMFMYSSAPMPVPLLEQAIARYGNIFLQVYTLSEAPVITTIMRPQEHIAIETSCGPRLGSCGREVVTMEIKLVDDDGREVAPGEVGEIAIRSINNMAGYWRLPKETAETLIDGWIRSGDMARRDADGYLYLADRKKDLIITGAFNVYPKEVEDVLYLHPAVEQCAVVGSPDPEWGEAIKAFVVRRANSDVSAEELIELCRNHLASYKKPRSVTFVDSLPTSPVGKIMRRALRDQDDGRPSARSG